MLLKVRVKLELLIQKVYIGKLQNRGNLGKKRLLLGSLVSVNT